MHWVFFSLTAALSSMCCNIGYPLKNFIGSFMNCVLITFTTSRNSFNLQNVRNISKVEQKPVSTTILLEENKKYDITIKSLKNGRILSVKSFKTRK